MGVINRRIYYSLVLIYVTGIFYTAYFLFGINERLIEVARFINLQNIQEINPVLLELYLLVGGLMACGFLILMISFLNNKNSSNEKEVEIYSAKGQEVDQETVEDMQKVEADFDLENKLKVLRNLAGEKLASDLYAERFLSELCNQLEASQGAIYHLKEENDNKFLELYTAYAFTYSETQKVTYEIGEGLAGQVAKTGKSINVGSIPEGYITIISGLGQSSPSQLLINAINTKDEVSGVIEIASFSEFKDYHEKLIDQAMKIYGERMATIKKEDIVQKEAVNNQETD